jgi:hypothetical protein
MTTVFAKHEPYDDGHLGEVGLDMDHAGAPTIRAVLIAGNLYAVDGSHRLAQAHYRGLILKVIVLESDLHGDPRIPADLPRYDFDYVIALRESDFADEAVVVNAPV